MKHLSSSFSCSVVSDCLQPHGLQHAKLPCPSPTPRACSNSCPLCRWCHPAISSSGVPFSSCPQSFPASCLFFFFLVSQLFSSSGQSMMYSATYKRFSVTGILCKELQIARQQEMEQPDKGTVPRTLHANPGRSMNFNLKVIGSHWMTFSKKMASVQQVLEHLLHTRHPGCLRTRQVQTSPSNQDWQRRS